jgi:hypothetical protein
LGGDFDVIRFKVYKDCTPAKFQGRDSSAAFLSGSQMIRRVRNASIPRISRKFLQLISAVALNYGESVGHLAFGPLRFLDVPNVLAFQSASCSIVLTSVLSGWVFSALFPKGEGEA